MYGYHGTVRLRQGDGFEPFLVHLLQNQGGFFGCVCACMRGMYSERLGTVELKQLNLSVTVYLSMYVIVEKEKS